MKYRKTTSKTAQSVPYFSPIQEESFTEGLRAMINSGLDDQDSTLISSPKKQVKMIPETPKKFSFRQLLRLFILIGVIYLMGLSVSWVSRRKGNEKQHFQGIGKVANFTQIY